MAELRDERPTYKLSAQEEYWTAHKFIALLVVTLIVSIGLIWTAANASYQRVGGWTGFTLGR